MKPTQLFLVMIEEAGSDTPHQAFIQKDTAEFVCQGLELFKENGATFRSYVRPIDVFAGDSKQYLAAKLGSRRKR